MGENTLELSQQKLFSLTPDLRWTGFHRTQTQGLLPGPQAGGLDDHRPPDRRIQFCTQLHIAHLTGIPCTPQGQGMVERAHLSLKTTTEKT